MRTRLLLPETAVPVYEQDDENMVFMNMIENIMIHEHHDWEHHEHDIGKHQGLRASLREHSLHEHDDGEHHVHEHDHCEHHEHEHPVHEQDNWVHHRYMNNTMEDIMNLMIEHIIHEYPLYEQAYSEQHNSYFRSSMQITWIWTKMNDFNHYRNKRKLNSTLGRIHHKLLALHRK